MFPTFKQWQKLDIFHEDDTYENPRGETQYEQYKLKYEIVSRLKPKSIVEIGVRLGYSAFAFLSANPTAFYIGIDIQNNEGIEHGGLPFKTFPFVKEMLSAHFPDASIILIEQDSRKQDIYFEGFDVDFVYVDGDHTFEGCLQDIQNWWSRAQKALLVDDYDFIEEVRSAVDDFVKTKLIIDKENLRYRYFPSWRGDVLLYKENMYEDS